MAFKAFLGAACVALFASNLSAGLPPEGYAGRTHDVAVATDMRLSSLNLNEHETVSDLTAPEIDPVDVLLTSISADPTGMALPKTMRAAGMVTSGEAMTPLNGLMYVAPALILILGGSLGLAFALTWRKRMAFKLAG